MTWIQKQPPAKKLQKSVAVFSLNNDDSPTLTLLSLCKPGSDCISVLFFKYLYNSFIKPVHKPPHMSSSKSDHIVVHKCSVCLAFCE